MSAAPVPPNESGRRNPVLWMVIGLPLIAVVASFASLALAITRGDSELPANYHWEGPALDRDDARTAAAAELGIVATLRVDPAAQRCTVHLQGAAPAALRLTLTHPTDQKADRHLLLPRAAGADYLAPCAALTAAHWWVELADDQGSWLLRQRVQGTLAAPLTLPGAGRGTAPPGTVAP